MRESTETSHEIICLRQNKASPTGIIGTSSEWRGGTYPSSSCQVVGFRTGLVEDDDGSAFPLCAGVLLSSLASSLFISERLLIGLSRSEWDGVVV